MARLNIAMLSAQEQTQVEQVEVQSELDVVGQQAEDAIAEAVQVQGEIEQTQQAAEDAEEVVQQVEEERQVLEQAQAQGGAEQAAMESLQRAMKRFEKRTGVPSSISSMGMESFGSKTTRAQSTKIAMEGAKEYIKKLIKMLMDAVAAIWEKVKAFFDKIWVGAERLAKRAKQVEDAAKAAQGKTAPADAKVTTASVLKFARQDDKAVEGGKFVDAFIAQTADGFVTRKANEKTLAEFIKGDKVSAILAAAKKADNKEELTKAILETHISDPTSSKSEDGVVAFKGKTRLLGDYIESSVVMSKDATWEQVAANYNKVKGSIAVADDAKDGPKEVTPLTPEQAKKLANQAAGHMSSYKDMRSEQSKIDAEVKKLLAESKALEKEKDAPTEQLRVGTGAVRAAVNFVLQGLVSWRSYDINLTKAALDYAAASISAANGKGAAATGKQVATV